MTKPMNLFGFEKERLIVKSLREFIDHDREQYIAVFTGIRRIGKTVALRQLEQHYSGAVYIDFSRTGGEDAYLQFIHGLQRNTGDEPVQVLLVDEISYYQNYSDLVTEIAEIAWKYKVKVIITGSSPTHLLSLSSGVLGGRSKLFRLSVITFLEYLYFTDRISSYDDQTYIPDAEDFKNFLTLKGIEDKGLQITFDKKYFADYYSDIELSNRNSSLVKDDLKISQEEITSICDLLAYKLQLNVKYRSFVSPDEGAKEIGTKQRKMTDLSDTILSESSNFARTMTPKSKGRILGFLLRSGLAYVEIAYEAKDSINISQLIYDLEHVEKAQELSDIFEQINICIVTPLLYTRLARDIMAKVNMEMDDLLASESIVGMMLESYIKGQNAIDCDYQIIFTSYKIGEGINEVDLVDMERRLLCEITVSDKPAKSVHLLAHFKQQEFNRILTTKSMTGDSRGYRMIPYPQACIAVDRKSIYTWPEVKGM